jgi:hypothetical protein
VTAYVDVTLPADLRQKTLQETYNFTCECVACIGGDGVDMRSCCYCPKCEEGYVAVKDRGKAVLLQDKGMN